MKKVSLVLVLVLCIGILTSCASGGSSSSTSAANPAASGESTSSTPAPVTLTYVAMADDSGTIKDIVAAIEAQFPHVKVDLQEVPGNSDDVKKSLITSLAAGQGEPDIFNMDVIWTTQFASAGWLADLTDTLDKSLYLEGPLSTVTYNGKIWAVPSYTDVQLLYYRTDLLDAPPKTWDELLQMCREHQGKDGVDWGFLWQGFQGEPVVCNALTFIKSNGGNDIVDGVPVINSPQSKEALEFMRMLIKEGITSEEALAQRPADQLPIYQEGKALFMINWPSQYVPLQSEDSKVSGKFSATMFPAGPSGSSPGPTVGGWNIAVNAFSKNLDTAVEVAQYLGSEPVGTIRTLGQSTLPANSAVYANPEVAEKNPVVALCMDSLRYAASRPNAPDYPAMSQLLALNFNKALAGQMSIDDCLAEIEKGMAELI